MADEKPSLEVIQTVGDLPVEGFVALMLEVLDRRRAGGDSRLMDLTLPEFRDMMIHEMKTRAYQTATAEAGVAEQILTDWKALEQVEAITQPFRINNAQEAQKFADNLKETFAQQGWRGGMVIAVALVAPDGTYGSVKR